jgi:hypothetical protein
MKSMKLRDVLSGKLGIQTVAVFASGVTFLLVFLILAIVIKDPDPWTEFSFRVILARTALVPWKQGQALSW